jgi:hypothetical protein
MAPQHPVAQCADRGAYNIRVCTAKLLGMEHDGAAQVLSHFHGQPGVTYLSREGEAIHELMQKRRLA